MKNIGKNQDGSPQWLRTKEAIAQFGIGKTTLYALADFNGGELITSEIRQRGKTRGIRLWSAESLHELIESNRTHFKCVRCGQTQPLHEEEKALKPVCPQCASTK